MEVSESEAHANGEIESAPQPPNEPSTIYSLSSLGRQNSIYALTLDEFQHSFREDGKNFGSMNMDEFLTSIWTAEENQGVHSNKETSQLNQAKPTGEKSLPRQGSLTLPAPLCRKTVEEIWTEISREQQEKQKQQQQSNNVGNPGTTQRQPTFGEMTLEDFLVKAGVVREACGASSQHHIQTPATPAPAPQQYGAYELYQNSNTGVDLNFRIGPVAAPGGAVVQESSNYGLRRNGGFPGEASFGGRAGNVGRYEAAQRLMMGSPTSPVSSDGKCVAQVNNSGSTQYGLEMGGMRGRKRIGEGPPEKLVERRQRRMIKNRESAARSRARKQAYTVELEAELNQLKEENDRLKQILTENEKRKLEKDKPPTKVQNNEEKFRLMRSLSLP